MNEKQEEKVKEIIELAQIIRAIEGLNINQHIIERLSNKLEEKLKEYKKGIGNDK